MKKKKYLSEVLTVDEIAEFENNIICILAGVGAGKNSFVENQLSGRTLENGKSKISPNCGAILYITSRRAKADEILREKFCNDKIEWTKEDSITTILTNFQTELMLKDKKFRKNVIEIIEHFKYFVIDEAHSIATDSTYTSSSFHVKSLIEYVAENYPEKKVILLTGTPEPIESYLKLKKFTIIDKRSECINVVAKKIKVVTQKQAMKLIKKLSNEKVVYMANSATRILKGKTSLLNEIAKNIDIERIAICMSTTSLSRLKDIINPEMRKQSIDTYEYLINEGRLPENIEFLITTSRLKEGLNIFDIHVAFCESMLLSDIVQFMGRFRKGLDTLYVISDAKQNVISEKDMRELELDVAYTAWIKIKGLNDFYKNYLMNSNSSFYKVLTNFYNTEDVDIVELINTFQDENSFINTYNIHSVRDFVDLIEKTNDNVRFNQIENKFEIYAMKFIESKRVFCELRKGKDAFDKKMVEWVRQTEKNDGIKIQYIGMKSAMEERTKEIEEENSIILGIFQEHHLNKTILYGAEKEEIFRNISNLLGINENAKVSSINKKLEERNIKYAFSHAKNRRMVKGCSSIPTYTIILKDE